MNERDNLGDLDVDREVKIIELSPYLIKYTISTYKALKYTSIYS
jgi:hypothetical protein